MRAGMRGPMARTATGVLAAVLLGACASASPRTAGQGSLPDRLKAEVRVASIEEHLIEVRHSPEGPVSREAQKQEEHAIIRELQGRYATREERVEEWTRRTGKSERAFYRRRAELDVR